QYLKPIKNILERLQFRPPVAVLNINDDERELARIRAMLTKGGLPVANEADFHREDGRWVIQPVEHIKGLEYDTCIIFGLDGEEVLALDYARNGAYVAVSRPTSR